MIKSKFLFLTLIILFSFSNKGNSQTLTIQETIDYLNKILIQSPHKEQIRPLKLSNNDEDRLERIRLMSDSARHVYIGCNVVTTMKLSIDKEGFLTIEKFVTTTNCNDEKNNVNDELRESAKINVDDIDLEKIDMFFPKKDQSWEFELNDNVNECGAISLVCSDRDAKSLSYENKYGQYNYENRQWQYKFKIAAYMINIYSEDFKYDVKRFYNAIKYLIYSAKEQGYHRQRNDDPFVSTSIGENRINTHTNSKTEYRIPLKKENGVLTLMINLGGGIKAIFILDSGAGESNISSDLEKKLLVNGVIRERDYLTNGLYKLADGSIQECKRVRISKIVVGAKTLYNVNTSIGPANSPNLLGQSFLGRTSKWAIDNSLNYLIIQ